MGADVTYPVIQRLSRLLARCKRGGLSHASHILEFIRETESVETFITFAAGETLTIAQPNPRRLHLTFASDGNLIYVSTRPAISVSAGSLLAGGIPMEFKGIDYGEHVIKQWYGFNFTAGPGVVTVTEVIYKGK